MKNRLCLAWTQIKDHNLIWDDRMFWIRKILTKTKIVTDKICPSCSSQSPVDPNHQYLSQLKTLGRRKRKKSSLMKCLLRLLALGGMFKHLGQEKQQIHLRNYLKIIILPPWQSVESPRKALFRLATQHITVTTIRLASLQPWQLQDKNSCAQSHRVPRLGRDPKSIFTMMRK